MKINYILNDNREIVSWSALPFDSSKPHITVPDDTQIFLNCSQIIGGRFVQNVEKYNKKQQKAQKLLQNKLKISSLNQYLLSTDYMIIKDYEGLITSDEDILKLQEIKIKREEARAEINRLKKEIENSKKDS